MKNHKPWTITAKAKDEIEILLYEMIGMDFWTGEGTTAKSFAEDLKAAGDGIRKIHLRVNSPGGNVFDGLAIYNTLLSHGAKITAQVDGLSASIASVITMAASEISMGDNAMMMIHNPSTVVGGDAPEMRKMADTLDKVKTSMITSYRRHSSKSVEEIGALMDAETWMTAEETVENGFAEHVTTPEGDEADVAANFAPMLAKFRNVPQEIAARFAAGTSRTKRVDGENLTSNCFIYVGDEEKTDTWHLPWHFAEEEKTKSHLRDALSRFDETDIPASAKPAARAKLVRLCKEHGITVSDSDKKAAKALARMIAQVRADKKVLRTAGSKKVTVDPMLCACDCTACLKDDCSACVNADCEDENCDDCPMQEEEDDSAKASLPSAGPRRVRGVAIPDSPEAVPVETTKCGCTCQPCLDDNCKGCVNEDCRDENCVDCPMPKVRNERNEQDKQSRWMRRVGGELEQSAALYATASDVLTRRHQTAHELLHGGILPRLEAAEKLLTRLKAERNGEASSLGKWSERVEGELRQAAALPVAVVAEIAQLRSAGGDSVEAIDAAASLLGRLKTEHAAELTALRTWTERVGADLLESGVLHGHALDEIAQHAQQSGVLAQKIEAAQTLLMRLSSERASELTALSKWTERLSTELEQAGRLQASATEAISRILPQNDSEIEAADKMLAELKAERTAEVNALGRITSELAAALKAPLDQSPKLLAAVHEELSRRSRLGAQGELGIRGFVEKIEATQKLLTELKAERAAELTALARVASELQESAKVRSSVVDELARRSRLAEAAPGNVYGVEIGALADAPVLLGQLKTEHAAAVTAAAEFAGRVAAGLQASAKLQAAAAEEIERRHRFAETPKDTAEIDAMQTVLATLKTQRTLAAKATAELVARVTTDLEASAKVHGSAADDLARRARLAEASGEIGERIAAAESLVHELKECVASELATQSVCLQASADLKKAGEMCRSAVDDIARRGRMLALST